MFLITLKANPFVYKFKTNPNIVFRSFNCKNLLLFCNFSTNMPRHLTSNSLTYKSLFDIVSIIFFLKNSLISSS